MGPFDLGALGFWIFVAACVVSSDWKDSRIQAQKHETLRRIVDKTGAIDEAKMKELFSASSSDVRKPGGSYRGLRIAGTILMFVSLVPAILFGIAGLLCLLEVIPPPPPGEIVAIMAIPFGIAVLGYALFYSSRFAEPPAGPRNESQAS